LSLQHLQGKYESVEHFRKVFSSLWKNNV